MGEPAACAAARDHGDRALATALRQARINPLLHYLRSGKKEDWSI
jgi:hypothetical protein